MTLRTTSMAFAAGMAAFLLSGDGLAMTTTPAEPVSCRFIGDAKLLSGAEAASDLCRLIQAAASERVPGVPFAVEVRMRSASALVATVRMKDGRALAEQNMAISDSSFNRRSIARLAEVIAAQVADAARR